MRFKMDKDYISTGSGYYQKVSDGSGPYVKQAKDDYVLSSATGGGGSVDVLGTVIEAFSSNKEAPKAGDTLQITLDKLDTFDKTITTEFGALKTRVDGLQPSFTEAKVKNTKLTGLVVNNEDPVVAADTLLGAIGKLQARSSAQEAIIAANSSTIAGLQNTIADLTARLEALEGA